MGGKTRGGSIGSTVASKGKAVLGVQKGVPETEGLPSAISGAGLLEFVIITVDAVIRDRVLDHRVGREDGKKVSIGRRG